MMNKSLYLAQSYHDAWSDHQRALKSSSFPVWDYIILTASNSHQAKSFRLQIDARREFIPSRTETGIIADEGGVRVGSGGATLSVLKWLNEKGGFEGKKVLVIHSGGDSKRVPQYSALGKLFSPVPHRLPDGRSSTLFDELLVAMSPIPGRIREGMLILAGDVLPLFNPLLVDWNGNGAAAISFKEDVETGKAHGVFLRGEDGYVRSFLHKQSVTQLKRIGAVNDHNMVDIDTGAILFGVDLMNALFSLISTDEVINRDKYDSLVNDRVRLSLYGDFQYPLAADSTLEGFYKEKPEGEYTEELKVARKLVWDTLRPYRVKLLRLAPAKFIHFGTTVEILELMSHGVSEYENLGWSNRINCSMDRISGYDSVLSPMASVGEDSYLEVSCVRGKAKIGNNCVLSYVDIDDETIPDGVVLHGLKQANGRFVCRIFGKDDNPKESKLFGMELNGSLWDDDKPHNLWNAKIYPEKETMREAIRAALNIYKRVQAGENLETGKSLAEGFNEADPEAILAWNRHLSEQVIMYDILYKIQNRIPSSSVTPIPTLTEAQSEWKKQRLMTSDYSEEMRLHYYVGTALRDETEVEKAFTSLSSAILKSVEGNMSENVDAKICEDEVEVKLPLRVNWGGGWSDTPPYCNENGGTVLNAAILLNGERPVSVKVKRLKEKKIVFESRDMDTHGEFNDMSSLQSVGDPYDPYVLQKAALLACGVIPRHGGSLEDVFSRIGGGIWIDTEVTGVPKGSGLGTSSILAAACVKALLSFLGVSFSDSVLYERVLCMEQIMSTGGGWQDQVGGITDGIKYITSKPGLRQEIKVDHILLDEKTKKELNDRFVLIYTGQRRLARNLLRDVVGRYIGNEKDSLHALNEIQRLATLMRFELERGHVDDFAALLSEHWELSKMIDAGSTNTLIDQIFDSSDDLLAGKMVCGAGGGGFLQVVLKNGVTKIYLQERLKEVFSDTDINVWECELV